MVYPRWRYDDGSEFPFTEYDRSAHLAGLNFVGTEVMLSPAAAEIFNSAGGRENPEEALRELARLGFSFLGINKVTYERERHAG